MNIRILPLIPALILYAISLNAQSRSGISINGRIQFDYEFLKRERDNRWQVASEFRRIYLSAKGLLNERITYKMEFNFAGSQIDILDMYIAYRDEKMGTFALGSRPEPTGLDIGTSSKYIPFFERAMLTTLQDRRWGAGLHYAHTRLLKGNAGIQLALTGKASGLEGFSDNKLEEGGNFAARFFFNPVNNPSRRQHLHLGVNYATRPYKDLKFRPENHSGDKYHYVFDGGTRRLETGFETALVYGSFSVQGEYKMRRVANDLDKDYKVAGYYALVSFFPTGESRPYQKGAFGRVKPFKDMNNGGYGAFELVVRYSVMNFSPDVTEVVSNAGMPEQINNLGVGFNWYLTSRVRMMYNFILTDDGNTQGKLQAHLIRFQMDF